MLPDIPAIDAQTSVIAHATSWNGTFDSSGSLHIHGKVEGALTARDDVFIAEEAEVDAVITATNVIVAGNVRGTIRCADRFEVLPRGRIIGDINAPVMVVHEGALIAGEVSMSSSGASLPSSSPPLSARAARGGD
jgi:cytoskeletal protein CcmA (bactofilin family)